MSKIISIQSAATFIPSSYNTSISTGVKVNNSGNYIPSHGLYGAENSSSYAFFSGQTMNTSGFAYYNFSVTGIPSNATITKVSCSARTRTSSTSRGRASIQLCSNTTQKGVETHFTSTTASVYLSSGGTWTVSDLANATIRIKVVWTSNNGGYAVRFYGATLGVNYTVNGVAYEVTVTNTSSNAEVSPTYFSGATGEDFTLNITGIGNIDDIIVTDNGNDVTSQLTYHSSISRSLDTIPNALDSSAGTVSNVNNGLADTSSNDYAQVNASTGAYLTYSFDVSQIPSNATIDSVECSVKAACTRTYGNAGSAQLYAGSTAKGSSYTFGSTASVFNLTTGTWTRNELNSIKLRLGSTYTGTNTYYTRFYGADLTINYTVNEVRYTYTLSNITEDHDIEVSDAVTKHQITATSTFNGVSITPTSTTVIEGNMAEFTINSQNTYSIKLLDNGVDKTSTITGSAGNYKYRIQNVTSAHTLVLSEATYYTVTGSSTYTGATVSAPGKVYAGQNATVTVSVGNKYEIVFKDNNVDKTSSLAGSTGTLTYTLTNVQANHTIAVSEATNYTITTSSSYNGVTVTANPTKVYAGRSCTVTIAGASKDTMTVKDNNTDVTSSLVGSSSPYTYTLNNVSANHTITVEEKPAVTYQVNASSTYSRATITPTASTVVEGDTLVLTITGDTVPIKVTDNNVDVTSSLVTNGATKTYTLTNIVAAHTIVVSFVQTALVRTSSGYVAGKKFYKKTGASTWTEMTLSEMQTYIQNNSMFYDPYNGHPYVDLGLPSGTLWATCNVGANSPEEFGGYFAWGETSPKAEHQTYNYALGFWDSDYPDCNMIKYNSSDGLTVLLPEDDAARVNMGGEWRMPTEAQMQELSSNTTLSQHTINGINGCLLTSRNNGKTIFFPYMGWSQNGDIYNVGESFAVNSRDIMYPGWIYCGFANTSSTSFLLDDEDPSCAFIGRPVRGVIG